MMVDHHGISGGGEGGDNKLSLKEGASASYRPYPPPQATYEDVVASRELFTDTLKKLHAAMGTKFMIPIVGGKNLDLYRLFVEVTSRGGIAKVVKEKKWKEVTSVFNFPSSATNASFILRKYYVSLLYHYEQIYFFKAKWTPLSPDALQQVSMIASPPHGLAEHLQQSHPALAQQKANTSAVSTPQVSLASSSSSGSPVCGVIDGKFESGYLITVRIGSEDFKGVLYQIPSNYEPPIQYPSRTPIQRETVPHPKPELPIRRRKRRKKSEMRKRDPAHPKPNRSGYNFFFAEQHAKLKPLYHGRDREISRMIGELWNKLQEPERAVYQEKALKDKERYKAEMEKYRERLSTGQIVNTSAAVQPIQQQQQQPPPPPPDLDINLQYEGSPSAHGEEEEDEENEMSTEKSGEDQYETVDKDLDFGEFSRPDMELRNVSVEVLADGEAAAAFELQTKLDRFDEKKMRSSDEEREMRAGNVGESVGGH